MFGLLYFIESDKEYQKFIAFYRDKRGVVGFSYLIFHEDVKCNDGRIFRTHNNILIAVDFITHKTDLRERLVEAGLESDLLVNKYELAFEGLDPDDGVSEKAKRIIAEEDLITFLNNLDFRFRDGSILTISKLGARIAESLKLMEKLKENDKLGTG